MTSRFLLLLACTFLMGLPAIAQQSGKPNILVIWGDDIGIHNISAYNLGVMGYRTPNIDSLAKEGALFTDAYAQQSCTAGRASFILGQKPVSNGSSYGRFPRLAARNP
jgi:arylsulfatase A-like enzyme